MYFMGGKKVIGKEISKVIKEVIMQGDTHRPYMEPFVGMCGIMLHMTEAGQRPCFAFDLQPDLIALWQDICQGWHPPQKAISKAEYDQWRQEAQPSSMRAFVGYGCSYSGKFFGGYIKANSKETPRWEKNRLSLERVIPHIAGADIRFQQADYRDLDLSQFPRETVIVCDPPYFQTTGFSVGSFDHQEFWNLMREWSRTNDVIICEQQAPEDFVSIWQRPITRNMHFKDHNQQAKMEHLFIHESVADRLFGESSTLEAV